MTSRFSIQSQTFVLMRKLAWTFFLLVWAGVCEGQQIIWSKLFPLSKTDHISCLVNDTNQIMYAGGDTERNKVFITGGIYYYRAIIIKLDSNGDTIFIKDLGIPGMVYSMAIDPNGNIRANVTHLLSQSTLFISLVSNCWK